MVKAHAPKQIMRSPGKLVLLTGLDLLKAEHLMQEVDELMMLKEEWVVVVPHVGQACQLHLSLCHQDLQYEAAGHQQNAALMWLEEQMDVHLPTMCNRTEICLSSSSDCNSSKQINGKSYITQCNCSCTGSSWLLPHRLYITFFSKSLFKGTPWDLSLKRKFKCCDSSLGC